MTVIPLLRRRRAPQCYTECTARFQGKCLCTAPQAGSQNCITCQNSAGKQKHTAKKKEKKIIHRNPAFCAPAPPRGAPRQNSDEKNTRKGRKRKEGESLTQKIPPPLPPPTSRRHESRISGERGRPTEKEEEEEGE